MRLSTILRAIVDDVVSVQRATLLVGIDERAAETVYVSILGRRRARFQWDQKYGALQVDFAPTELNGVAPWCAYSTPQRIAVTHSVGERVQHVPVQGVIELTTAGSYDGDTIIDVHVGRLRLYAHSANQHRAWLRSKLAEVTALKARAKAA